MSDIMNHNPDILTCLANLSNDEVFTPPDLANKLLDLIPADFWKDPNVKVLDPACKSGVFLREAAKRFIKGLEPVIPVLQERLDHIFHKQLFGYAITELTSYMSRRSLYCSKYANGPYSITTFKQEQGKVLYNNIKHTWDEEGKCLYCGAPKDIFDRSQNLESYAYDFIHLPDKKIKELQEMKFDLIISNPPYQLSDGGAQASAKPIYNLFVETAKKLNPRFLTMIIPARWYAGGKGLDDFRDAMLEDSHIQELHDFPNTEDCFPGVNIRGGICYFLWSRTYNNNLNKVNVSTHNKNEVFTVNRSLKIDNLDIFLRYNQSISILNKIITKERQHMLSKYVSARKPFGLGTDFITTTSFNKSPENLTNPIPCYGKGKKLGYVELNSIPMHREWIGKWKLFTPRANNIGTELNDDNLNIFEGYNEICTESYLVIGMGLDLNHEQIKNLAFYLQTKFARFCHSLAKASQDATAKTYRFVPLQDFSKPWTDEELYKKYNLTDEEINFIESMIKPMDLGADNE